MDARSARGAAVLAVALVIFGTGAGYKTANFVVMAPTPQLAEKIGRMAERRIGRDAGIAGGTAALQRQLQAGKRHRRALGGVGDRQHLADDLGGDLDRLARAAAPRDTKSAK